MSEHPETFGMELMRKSIEASDPDPIEERKARARRNLGIPDPAPEGCPTCGEPADQPLSGESPHTGLPWQCRDPFHTPDPAPEGEDFAGVVHIRRAEYDELLARATRAEKELAKVSLFFQEEHDRAEAAEARARDRGLRLSEAESQLTELREAAYDLTEAHTRRSPTAAFWTQAELIAYDRLISALSKTLSPPPSTSSEGEDDG